MISLNTAFSNLTYISTHLMQEILNSSIEITITLLRIYNPSNYTDMQVYKNTAQLPVHSHPLKSS
jgi:hypothetical protein